MNGTFDNGANNGIKTGAIASAGHNADTSKFFLFQDATTSAGIAVLPQY
jgi:hypothetical protein